MWVKSHRINNSANERSGSMSANCHTPVSSAADPAYRRVLILALLINAIMFAIELGAGIGAQSQALKADALDFFGDAMNYALSLFVLARSLRWRASTALVKGVAMAAFGLWVGYEVLRHLLAGTIPDASTMGLVGLLALVANAWVAVMLYRWRAGDSNMRSVWLCSRNDAIGNVAVMIAAAAVWVSGDGWPDLIVAALMAGLALWSAGQVIAAALSELRAGEAQA
jgi:Co/Zn/Cd efflux system component